MRIESLSSNNAQMQGRQRREWLRQHAPQHLEQSRELILRGLRSRSPAAAQNALVLGAGACTEVPLMELARSADEVVLVDLDAQALERGRNELTVASLRHRVRLLNADVSGGVSTQLARLVRQQSWKALRQQGARAVFDAAAECLERCPVPDPPQIETLANGDFGLVVSSLVLSQIFSYPLLDLLDHVQQLDSEVLGEQERHRRYQDAAQQFRIRVIEAHLHLLQELVDSGGVVVLLNDIRGFVFNVHGTDHDASHRRTLPLVPRIFPELVQQRFVVEEETQWEWLTDLPEKERPGRGYEVMGYILRSKKPV